MAVVASEGLTGSVLAIQNSFLCCILYPWKKEIQAHADLNNDKNSYSTLLEDIGLRSNFKI